MIKPFGWLSRPSAALPRTFDEPRTADSVLLRHLLWRRRVLILVVVLTALTAVIDTST